MIEDHKKIHAFDKQQLKCDQDYVLYLGRNISTVVCIPLLELLFWCIFYKMGGLLCVKKLVEWFPIRILVVFKSRFHS